jgi:predicted Zn-dependent peptidase
MSIELTTLANGVRVVSHAMSHVETVSLGVFVGTGARHEAVAEQGISHMLEHMAFKGTARRSARAIAEEIEQVGGELNAATGAETTAYYARVLKGDEGLALEILADILQNPTYAADELEREREVILQEIAGINDSPDDLAFDMLHEAAFPGQPAGRPIIGTRETVRSIGADRLRAFLAARYRGPGTVISAAGAIDHGRLVRHAEALFGGMSEGAGSAPEPAVYGGGERSIERTFEQCHLVVGFASPSYRDPDFFAAQVLSCLLGGGMSSRLFQEVRERRGLCYSIYSSAWGLADAGLFAVHAATGPQSMGEMMQVVADEIRAMTRAAPSAVELQRAKAQIKAGLLMSLESTSARAEQMARQLLIAGRLVATSELIERVEAVRADGVQGLAGRIFSTGRPAVAVVGAGRKSRRHAAAAAAALKG